MDWEIRENEIDDRIESRDYRLDATTVPHINAVAKLSLPLVLESTAYTFEGVDDDWPGRAGGEAPRRDSAMPLRLDIKRQLSARSDRVKSVDM